MIGGLLAMVLLLLANAFFVAVEFAVIAARRTKLATIASEGGVRARLAERASHHLSIELAGAQLGVTMSSLALGFVAEPVVSHLIESGLHEVVHLPEAVLRSIGFVVALVVVSLLHMIVGEMVPKNIALAEPERALMWLALPDRIYLFLFAPVVHVLNGLANAGTRIFGVQPTSEVDTVHSADELAHLLADSRSEGLIPAFEHELLAGALSLAHRPVAEVALPWPEVTSVPRTATVEEIETVVVASGHSRIPVLGAHEEVLGFLHAKDLLTLPVAARSAQLPFGRLRRMLLVEQDATLEDVLLTMQRVRIHLAVVRSSDGDPIGLVSLEDLLEELVGDISDESDAEDASAT